MKRLTPLLLLLPAIAIAATADDTPKSRVQYTPARQHDIQKRVVLPGTVEAPKSSQVASEVEGAVAELHAREGRYVERGAPLVSLKSEHLEYQLQAAQAQHREAEARFALAERNLGRSRELFAGEVLSRQQLDDAGFELDAWRGRIDQLTAEIRRIQLDLERSVVKAPFSGIVASEMTEVGQWVGKGATVMELLAPYELEVRVEVPERHFADFKKGTAVRVTFDTMAGYEVQGKVASLVPRASSQARTFPLRIRISNADGRIGAGMIANVALDAGASEDVILVPKDALITRGASRFVYVVGNDQTVKLLPVTTGESVGGWVAVEGTAEPITIDTRVVTRGNERVRPGQQVLAELMEYPAP
jgi:membrane fusion protein (multidrug efflux system)